MCHFSPEGVCIMTTDLKSKHVTNNVDGNEDIQEIYDCDVNPLSCMIEPKGSVDIIDKDVETTKEDLEHVL